MAVTYIHMRMFVSEGVLLGRHQSAQSVSVSDWVDTELRGDAARGRHAWGFPNTPLTAGLQRCCCAAGSQVGAIPQPYATPNIKAHVRIKLGHATPEEATMSATSATAEGDGCMSGMADVLAVALRRLGLQAGVLRVRRLASPCHVAAAGGGDSGCCGLIGLC